MPKTRNLWSWCAECGKGRASSLDGTLGMISQDVFSFFEISFFVVFFTRFGFVCGDGFLLLDFCYWDYTGLKHKL